MAVLILEHTTSRHLLSTLYVDIGGLDAVEILTLSADLNRRYTLVGTVKEALWERKPEGLGALIPLLIVVPKNLWRFVEVSHELKLALLATWDRQARDSKAMEKILLQKLEKVRAAMLEKQNPHAWTRFSLIE